MPTFGYVNPYRNKGVECENLALVCMDFRFRKKINELLSQAGYRDFDILVVPGASKAIIDDSHRQIVLNALKIAVSLHGIRRLIMVDHIDCGTYGGSSRFPGQVEEMAFHTERLHEAYQIIKSQYPMLEIVLMYIDWDKLQEIAAF